jgi:general stress protein CsbA
MIHKEEPSIGELFADLSRETSTLVRKEVELAKVELSTKASKVGKDAAFIGAGAAVAYAGFLAIVAGIIIVLAAIGLPWWLSAFIVGIVVAGVGGFLVQKGLDALKHEDMAPRETVQTLKEDVQWAKEQTQ